MPCHTWYNLDYSWEKSSHKKWCFLPSEAISSTFPCFQCFHSWTLKSLQNSVQSCTQSWSQRTWEGSGWHWRWWRGWHRWWLVWRHCGFVWGLCRCMGDRRNSIWNRVFFFSFQIFFVSIISSKTVCLPNLYYKVTHRKLKNYKKSFCW